MEKLKSIDYRMVLFLLLVASTPFVSPNIALPVAIIILAGSKALADFIESRKPIDPTPELKAEIQAIKNQMSGIMVKNAAKPEDQSFKRLF